MGITFSLTWQMGYLAHIRKAIFIFTKIQPLLVAELKSFVILSKYEKDLMSC
jgi:hypothetical protein